MFKRVRRKLTCLLPASSDISIPLQFAVQTALLCIFSVTLRWSSVLVTALVVTVAVRDESLPVEGLTLLASMAWADRTAVTYLRLRHR